MNIFENIKNGYLPTDEIVFSCLKEIKKDEKNEKEIKNYINILNNALSSSFNIEERFLLSKVIFVLESLIQKNDNIENFLFNLFTLNIYKVNQNIIDFINELLNEIDEDSLFNNLNKIIQKIDIQNKENLRTFFNWLLHHIWSSKRFYASKKFTIFYDSLRELLIKLRDSKRIDEMMYVEFFTYHIMGNNFQTIDEWKDFNEKITKETIKAYKEIIPMLPKANPKSKNKKRIAFVKDRIVFNSPYMVEYSLFKNLMNSKEFRDNYELIVYSFNLFEKNEDGERELQELQELGIKVKNPVESFKEFGYYNNHLDKAITLRQAIIDDDIDIMMGGGVLPFMNFLYVTRSAPLQIYYSHGNCAYDVPNIDKRVSHFEQKCKEFEWNIINVPMAEEFLVGSEGEKTVGEIIKKDYKEKFGEDVVILGTIGRLVKIDSDEYIKAIAKIMKDNPNTIYLACGKGEKKGIKEKLKKYNIDEKKFLFLGQVKPHIYGWVIDVWPDSFPQGQGQSKDEFVAKKRPVIHHVKRNLKITEETKDYIAENDEMYIKMVTDLIKNEENRKKLGELEYKIKFKNKFTNFLEVIK